MLEQDIKLQVFDIKVEYNYFSFNYKVFVNGKLNKQDNFSSSHIHNDNLVGFEKTLKDGYAFQLILESI